MNQRRTISNDYSYKSYHLPQNLDQVGNAEAARTFQPRFTTDIQMQKLEILCEFRSQYKLDHAGDAPLGGWQGPDNEDSLFHRGAMSAIVTRLRSGTDKIVQLL